MVSARERRMVERRTRMAATGRGMRLVCGVRRCVERSVMAGCVMAEAEGADAMVKVVVVLGLMLELEEVGVVLEIW